MTSIAIQDLTVDIFLEAIKDGPCTQPAWLQRFMNHRNEYNTQLDTYNDDLHQALIGEFPFLNSHPNPAEDLDTISRMSWVNSVRFVLNKLRDLGKRPSRSIQTVQVLLAAANILDLDREGLKSIAKKIGEELPISDLFQIVDNAIVSPFRGIESRFPNIRMDFKNAIDHDNYTWLSHILPHILPEFRGELTAAIICLWKISPEKLAEIIDKKDDVLFSIYVHHILQDSSIKFALNVKSISFKFISINDHIPLDKVNKATPDWRANCHNLLLQIAQKECWPNWMNALYQYIDLRSPTCGPLIDALISLEEKHWKGFIEALSLGYSHTTTQSVAKILYDFSKRVSTEKAKAMWQIAFERWDSWDYGKNDKETYHFAPIGCVLDYPVSMYYSKLEKEVLDIEESKLKEALEGIEQKWFDCQSSLITERNRILSRLRLIHHARRLAVEEVDLLPPPVQPDSCDYNKVRYHYYNAYANESITIP